MQSHVYVKNTETDEVSMAIEEKEERWLELSMKLEVINL